MEDYIKNRRINFEVLLWGLIEKQKVINKNNILFKKMKNKKLHSTSAGFEPTRECLKEFVSFYNITTNFLAFLP